MKKQRVEVSEAKEFIELRVTLSSGGFDSSVKLPVEATEVERNSVVAAWFDLIQTALKVGKK